MFLASLLRGKTSQITAWNKSDESCHASDSFFALTLKEFPVTNPRYQHLCCRYLNRSENDPTHEVFSLLSVGMQSSSLGGKSKPEFQGFSYTDDLPFFPQQNIPVGFVVTLRNLSGGIPVVFI